MPARLREIYSDRETMEFRQSEPMEVYATPPIDPSQIRAGELAVPIQMVFGNLRSRSYLAGQEGWSIEYNGDAEFNNVTVRGTIISESGDIAGFIIDENTISKNDLILDSTGKIVLGLGNDTIQMSSVDSTYRLWIGHATPASAPFSVTKAGVFKATSGDIAGIMTIGGDNSVIIDGTNARITVKNGSLNSIIIGNI
jgi:hypothetical protein